MRATCYLLGLLLSLPLFAFALGVLALGHAIRTGNVLTLLWELFVAFAWLLPALALASLAFLVPAFFAVPRLVASAAVVLLNVAALAVVLGATGLPRGPAEAVFLVPTFAALGLHGGLLLERRAAAADAAGPAR